MTGAALVFRLGPRRLAVDAAQVIGVARRPPLSRVPGSHPALAGLGAFGGRATPVVDLARLLDGTEGEAPQVLLLRGGAPLGVAVDVVEGVRARSEISCDGVDLRAAAAPALAQNAELGGRFVVGDARRREGSRREVNFLAFEVAGQRFAFPVEEVRAVMREPEALSATVGADAVVLGAAPYRGGALPIVEAAGLLGLPSPRGRARLFVVEVGGVPVGLRVARALGAVRVGERDVSLAPAALNRGAVATRVEAVARTPLGLIAVLRAERLIDDETRLRLGALAVTAPAPEREASAGSEPALVVCRVGERRYGLSAAAVEAVARPGSLAPAPQAPDFVRGVTVHRGEAVPVIDARLRLGAKPSRGGLILILRTQEGKAALWVDAVEGLSHASSGGAAARGALARLDADAFLAEARSDVAAHAAARPRRARA